MTKINEYSDDLVTTARSKKAMEELLKTMNVNANELGLGINQEKTKYREINAQKAIEIRIKM
jgi:adenine/guanine phosphoribosyltransferase-like PRPP-binding protein